MSPYIVTTKRKTYPSTRGSSGTIARSTSRVAVATLEEARAEAADAVGESIRLRVDAWDLPESGGTVGPLPDGTVIEVKRTTWHALWRETGCGSATLRLAEEGIALAQETILDAFNAREARA